MPDKETKKNFGEEQILSIAQIKPYWRNPRINAEAIDAIASSIEEYGYLPRIVVDKKYVIVVGDTRYRAMQRLGYKEIPVIVADHLTAKQAKAFRIVDNKSGELASWDTEKLVLELRELSLPSLEIFFPNIDLEAMVQESTGAEGFHPLTEADLAQAATDDLNKVDRNEVNRNEALTQVFCPNCGHDFQLV